MDKGGQSAFGGSFRLILRSTGKTAQNRNFPDAISGATNTGMTSPAGWGLQRFNVGAACAEDGTCSFKAGLFVMGNAGDQIEPLLQTFHDVDSFE